jgi:multidrug efflux pump subunit AcrB
VKGKDVGSVAAEAEARLKAMQFPSEYYPTVRAASVEQQEAQRGVLWAFLAALIGVFLVLQACFRSWTLALATFIAVPASLLGAVIAVHATGNALLLGSLIGCVAVVSLAVRQCILFVRHCQDLELREAETFGPALVRRVAREQFAPVLMTAVATAVALSPFLYYGDTTGLEIVHPLVIVILCGLVTSTLLNLFVMPLIYLSFGSRPEPEMNFEPADLRSA